MREPSPAVYDYLNNVLPKEDILLSEPMAKHTTFRVGGPAMVYVKISNEEQLKKIIPYLQMVEQPYFIKGNGSNILVSDKGYDGVILDVSSQFSDISVEGDTITASSGALMSKIAHAAMENSLTGFEFASGIPGTIGGGVVMNAGAYDGEMKDVVTSVKIMDKRGEILTLDNRGMEFGYRTSAIKERDFVVLEVAIKLVKGDKEAIVSKMEDLALKRKSKQPLEYPSAGSTFKRPEGYFAGKLIMDAGLRGYSIGGAAVSEKHCGFVINKSDALAEDVYEVICEVREKVKARFGVLLEPEIIFLGDF